MLKFVGIDSFSSPGIKKRDRIHGLLKEHFKFLKEVVEERLLAKTGCHNPIMKYLKLNYIGMQQ